MEREGLGASVWRERDCISLVRAVIREMSGSEPVFALPDWTDGLDEQEAILRAPREHGSLRAVLIGCWKPSRCSNALRAERCPLRA